MTESFRSEIRHGLEGRSFRSTLRLYITGMAVLAPVVTTLIWIYGFDVTFKIAPFLVVTLAIVQYCISYLPVSVREVESESQPAPSSTEESRPKVSTEKTGAISSAHGNAQSGGISLAFPIVNGDSIEVSVVIPCLNEMNTIGACIETAQQAFKEAGVAGEVVVSDNGSTDGSIELSRSLGARVVHADLRGYGHALRKGLNEARGQFIIMGDADDSYEFTEVPRFVERWRAGYDIVMVKRVASSSRYSGGHIHIGTRVFSGVLGRLFHTRVEDAYRGMRAFTKQVYSKMDLRATGTELALEIIIKGKLLKAKTTEVPIGLGQSGPAQLSVSKYGSPHLSSVARSLLWWSMKTYMMGSSARHSSKMG